MELLTSNIRRTNYRGGACAALHALPVDSTLAGAAWHEELGRGPGILQSIAPPDARSVPYEGYGQGRASVESGVRE